MPVKFKKTKEIMSKSLNKRIASLFTAGNTIKFKPVRFCFKRTAQRETLIAT